MRIAILTSDDIRHRYFANALAETHPVVAVLYENTGYAPMHVGPADLSPSEQKIFQTHFQQRTLTERRYFGDACHWQVTTASTHVEHIPVGQLHSPTTVKALVDADPDTLVVYGTNLIRDPILSRWSGRIVNLHLGLSPYYRGTATNFYPLVNGEPQLVGATIHVIDAGIDTGPILCHARPQIAATDGPHDIGCKAIGEGIRALRRALKEWPLGGWTPVPQFKPPRSRLYLRKDYHPRQVVELYRKLDQGMIAEYVRRAADIAPQVRLVREQGAWAATADVMYQA